MIAKDFTLSNGIVVNQWTIRSQTTDFKTGTAIFRLEGFISGNELPVIEKNIIVSKAKSIEWPEAAILGMTKAQLLTFCEGVLLQMDLTDQGLPCFKVEVPIV